MGVSCGFVTQKVANFSEKLATFCDYNRNESLGQNWLDARKKEGRQTVPICRPARRKEGASFVLPNDWPQYNLLSLRDD
jgi:hypothetical protein